ncbi:MAG: DoxX family protein [Lentisphaerae bacterium]|nr:DoxX family protein [Lentisphaerota bacterium]
MINRIITLILNTRNDINPGHTLLRLFIGGALLTHGWSKMFGGGLEQFTGFVASLGLPAPHVMAFLAAFTESIGAILLILGLLTRPVALMIMVNMLVAIIGVHRAQGFSGQELAWLYLMPALFFLLNGAGRCSFDALIQRQLQPVLAKL